MLAQISQTLSKPFPFTRNLTESARISSFFGFFIFIFLALFQPYGLNEITKFKYLFIFGYGLITFSVILITSIILSFTLRNTFIDNWTIGRSITLILFEILVIGAFNWLYTYLLGQNNINQYSLFKFVLITLEVSLIPSAFFIIIFERLLQTKNKEKALKISSNLQPVKVSNHKQTKFSLGINQNKLTIDLDQLLCIKAQGNYIEVFYIINKKLKKQLIRQTLSGIPKQVFEETSLKKCHRSYIVNFDKIEKVTGNARNFNLHVKDLNFSVPVSRKFPLSTINQLETSQHSIKA